MNPIPNHPVTTPFKASGTHWSLGWHTGSDIAAPEKTPIRAGRAGLVIAANAFDKAYGFKVIIKVGDEQDWYCHMPSGAAAVLVGEDVEAGQHIGAVGSTGNVTGPHLHLERRQSPFTFSAATFLDPMAIITHEGEDDMTPEQDALLKQIAAEVGINRGSLLDSKIDSLGAQIGEIKAELDLIKAQLQA